MRSDGYSIAVTAAAVVLASANCARGLECPPGEACNERRFEYSADGATTTGFVVHLGVTQARGVFFPSEAQPDAVMFRGIREAFLDDEEHFINVPFGTKKILGRFVDADTAPIPRCIAKLHSANGSLSLAITFDGRTIEFPMATGTIDGPILCGGNVEPHGTVYEGGFITGVSDYEGEKFARVTGGYALSIQR